MSTDFIQLISILISQNVQYKSIKRDNLNKMLNIEQYKPQTSNKVYPHVNNCYTSVEYEELPLMSLKQ